MLKKIVIILTICLWPLNLILNHGFPKVEVPKTVFLNDYQGEQLVLRNIHLYPTPLLARVYQNKPRIYINKYVGNFFALTDLNNYFFALHPEPITGNLNIFKYPFLDIVFFAFGIFYISGNKHKKIILFALIISILALSSLTNFEGYDFILWFPISLIIIHGIESMFSLNKKLFNTFSIIFIIFTIPEVVRSFFVK
jgi:hypothetical protein